MGISLRKVAWPPNVAVSRSFQESPTSKRAQLPRELGQVQTCCALGSGGSVQTRFRPPRLAS